MPDEPLAGVSFDLYERYALLGGIAPLFSAGTDRLRLLDVGGHTPVLWEGFRSMASAVVPEARVVVADIETAPGVADYVCGSCAALPFPDGAFDLVCSFDMLEHVQPERRAACLLEMLRVTADGLYVVFPSDSPSNRAAEDMLRDFLEASLKAPLPALLEHKQYGLPDAEAVRSVLGGAGHSLVQFGHGNIDVWLLAMLTYHTLRLSDGVPFVLELNRRFNQACAAGDWEPPHYRACFLLSKKKPAATLEALSASFRRQADGAGGFERVLRFCQTMLLLTNRGRRIEHLENELAAERRRSERPQSSDFIAQILQSLFGLARNLWPRPAPGEQIELICDEPARGEPVSGAVVIRGWALAPSGIESIGVHVDEAPAAPARFGLPRPDVGRARPGMWRAARSGFEYRAEGLAPGGHRLRLRAVSRGGAVRELEREFEVASSDTAKPAARS